MAAAPLLLFELEPIRLHDLLAAISIIDDEQRLVAVQGVDQFQARLAPEDQAGRGQCVAVDGMTTRAFDRNADHVGIGRLTVLSREDVVVRLPFILIVALVRPGRDDRPIRRSPSDRNTASRFRSGNPIRTCHQRTRHSRRG